MSYELATQKTLLIMYIESISAQDNLYYENFLHLALNSTKRFREYEALVSAIENHLSRDKEKYLAEVKEKLSKGFAAFMKKRFDASDKERLEQLAYKIEHTESASLIMDSIKEALDIVKRPD